MKYIFTKLLIVIVMLINLQLFAQKVEYEVVVIAGIDSRPHSISNKGYISGIINGKAYLWYEDSLKTIISALSSGEVNCNDSGHVVGTTYNTTEMTVEGFYYDGTKTTFFDGEGHAINDSGTIAGKQYTGGANGASQGFILKGNNISYFDGLGFSVAWVNEINNSNEVVGSSGPLDADNQIYHAYLYSNNSIQDLGTLGDSFSNAFGINDSSWVVGYSGGGSTKVKPFIWKQNTGMVELETLASGGIATAINNSGEVVGRNSGAATIWKDGKSIDLNTVIEPSDIMLWEAKDINDKGQIIVWGFQNNRNISVLLNPIIEADGIVVNRTGDESDADLEDGICDTDLNEPGRQCSFRAAIEQANYNEGADVITFNIPGSGVPSISPESPLPEIDTKIAIDATTQPGSGMVELNGSNAGNSANGLFISANNSKVQGLIINKFGNDGIKITGNSNTIIGNIIGTNKNSATGFGNNGNGISITNAINNIVGEPEIDKLNIIAGNNKSGILITGGSSSGNLIKANYIGTDTLGTEELGNANTGILIEDGANNNIIGIDSDLTQLQSSTKSVPKIAGLNLNVGNIIVNSQNLIKIKNADNNTILGTVAGLFKLPSGKIFRKMGSSVAFYRAHILIKNSKRNRILKSLIGGGLGDGIRITGTSSNFNKIFKTTIGTDPYGTEGLGVGGNGICIDSGAVGNQLGGVGEDSTLTIVSSKKYGVQVQDVSQPSSNMFTNIYNTTIGIIEQQSNTSNSTRGIMIKMPNLLGGVCVLNSSNTIIGKPEAPNVISGNGGPGILFKGIGSQLNKVISNLIGTTKDGAEDLGNEGDGITIVDSASNNSIGGLLNKLVNTIVGNRNNGIAILGSHSNNIFANRIGFFKGGIGTVIPLGNFGSGIVIQNSFKNIVHKSQVAANKTDGIRISGALSKLNKIFGVTVGSDSSASISLGNWGNGISIFNMANGNSIGGEGSDSSVTIVSSKKYGLFTSDLQSEFNNTIKNATVGFARKNAQPVRMPNQLGGICLENTKNMQIGTSSAPNMIAGNNGPGLIMKGFSTQLNRIIGNIFGTDSTGVGNLGNLGANIKLFNGASDNWIGDEKEENGNIVVASKSNGIELTNTSDNKIFNNKIGWFTRPNISPKKMPNLIGLLASNAKWTKIKKSIFSGNLSDGLRITGSGSKFIKIWQNAFGTDLKGEGIHGNGGNGISIEGGANNITIGGDLAKEKNFINSNNLMGVLLKSVSNIRIFNTNIGADAMGLLSPLYKNGKGGLLADRTQYSKIGTIQSNLLGNLFAGYDSTAIKIINSLDTEVVNNKITSSKIGIEAILNQIQEGRLKILRNNIEKCSRAISVENETQNYIAGNIISDNIGLGSGIHMFNSGGVIEGNIFKNDAGDAIYLEDNSNPTVTKNNIYDNAGFGLRNESTPVLINAQENWWGDAGGPSGQGNGNGDAVSTNVNYQNWKTKPVSVVVLGGPDTIYKSPGDTDTLFASVLNWENPNDVVDITISDSLGWLTGQTSFTITLDDMLGSSFPVSFSVPSGAATNTMNKVSFTATSRLNSNQIDNDDFYLVTYSPEITNIVLFPDSALITVGDSLQFTVSGFDQFNKPISFTPEWSTYLGTITNDGLYKTPASSGIDTVFVFDPATQLTEKAVVEIGNITGTKNEEKQLPQEYTLFQNYPNPFNPSTKIQYTIAKSPLLGGDGRGGLVTLKVYDILGREVATLVNENKKTGYYEVHFNASSLTSGIYFYRLQSGNFIQTKKMILLR